MIMMASTWLGDYHPCIYIIYTDLGYFLVLYAWVQNSVQACMVIQQQIRCFLSSPFHLSSFRVRRNYNGMSRSPWYHLKWYSVIKRLSTRVNNTSAFAEMTQSHASSSLNSSDNFFGRFYLFVVKCKGSVSDVSPMITAVRRSKRSMSSLSTTRSAPDTATSTTRRCWPPTYNRSPTTWRPCWRRSWRTSQSSGWEFIVDNIALNASSIHFAGSVNIEQDGTGYTACSDRIP